MKSSINPYISVIVVAYNRRAFLRDAVESVLNQTLARNEYEVVVSKNFPTEYDEEWEKRGVKLLSFQGQKYGGRIADALPHCKGDVICFLDDDMFSPDKLEKVKSNFIRDDRLGYLAHQVRAVDIKDGVLNPCFKWLAWSFTVERPRENASAVSRFLDGRGFYCRNGASLWFNNSSIAIRKVCLERFVGELQKINIAFDWFVFLCGFLCNLKMMYLADALSVYRIHPLNTSLIELGEDGFSEYFNRIRDYNLRVAKDQEVFVKMSQGTCLEKYQLQRFWYCVLRLLTYQDGFRMEKLRALTKYIWVSGFGRGLNKAVLFGGLLSVLSPNLVRNIAIGNQPTGFNTLKRVFRI